MYQVMMSDIARQRGDNRLAMQLLREAAETSRDPRLVEQATRLAVAVGEFGQAIELAVLWVELVPEDADVQQTLGNLYVVDKQKDKALPHFSRAIELTDDNHLGLLLGQLSETLARYADEEEALAVMRELVAHYPDRAELHLSHAALAGRYKRFDEASEAIDRAMTLNPDWEEAAVFKFKLLVERKHSEWAEGFAGDFLRKHPDAASLRTTLARHFIDVDKLDEAEQQYRQVYRQQPDSVGVTLALALLRLEDDDLDEARRLLERSLELQPRNDMARIYLGEIALREKRLDEAEKWFRAVDDGDQLFSARLRLSNVVRQREGLDAGLRELELIVPETAAQQAELAQLRGELLLEAKRADEAYEVLSAALEEQPDNTDLLYARAMISAQQKDVAGLEADLDRLLDIDPDNIHALNALGYTLADLTDRYTEAYDYVARALALKPDDPFILDSMGWVEYRRGNLAVAEDYLRRALDARNDAEIAAHLVEVLWQLDQRDQARSVWRDADRDFPDNELLRAVHDRFLR